MYQKTKKISTDMKEKLQDISEKPRNIKKSIIAEVFVELMENDPFFGDVLKLIKPYYNELEELTKENEDVKMLNKKLLEELNLVKNFLEELKAKNEANVQELNNLEKENVELRKELETLNKELGKFKMREAALTSVLKETYEKNETMLNSNECYEIKKMSKFTEVGKNKIRIPKLNLSAIQRSEDEGSDKLNRSSRSNLNSVNKSSCEKELNLPEIDEGVIEEQSDNEKNKRNSAS